MRTVFCCSSVEPRIHTLSPYSHRFATFLKWATVNVSPTATTATDAMANFESPLTYAIFIKSYNNPRNVDTQSCWFVSALTSDGKVAFVPYSQQQAETSGLRQTKTEEAIYCETHGRRYELVFCRMISMVGTRREEGDESGESEDGEESIRGGVAIGETRGGEDGDREERLEG